MAVYGRDQKNSMNGTKMLFDECDFPWNGDTTKKIIDGHNCRGHADRTRTVLALGKQVLQIDILSFKYFIQPYYDTKQIRASFDKSLYAIEFQASVIQKIYLIESIKIFLNFLEPTVFETSSRKKVWEFSIGAS